MRESIFNIKVKVDEDEYIYNSRNNGIIQINKNDLKNKKNREYLLKEQYFVEDNFDEILDLEKEINRNINEGTDSLILTIALTERCNFNCVYCYQNRKPKNLEASNAKELITVIETIIKENNYKGLAVHYFGGEPLLNLDMLYFLNDEFKRISKVYSINYEAVITTNGSMLTKEILQKVNFKRIQLTFDGLENNHNRLRESSSFKFKDTIELITIILSYCESINLRFNVCEENKNDLIPFIKVILNKFDKDKVNFIIAQTTKYKPTDKFNMISFDEFAKLNFEARLVFNDYGKKIGLPTSLMYPCKITNRNALVISPDLSIIECDECDKVLKDHFSKEIVKEKKHYFISEECRKCNVLPLCLGGCKAKRDQGYCGCIVEKNIIKDLVIKVIRNKIKLQGNENV